MTRLTQFASFSPATSLVRDARETAQDDDPTLGRLPRWDFTALYAEPVDEAIEADFVWAEQAAKTFAERYESNLLGMSGDQIAAAIAEAEAISEKLGRIGSFVYLNYAQQVTDPARAKRLGDSQARMADLTAPMVFFELELNRFEDDALEALIAESAALQKYKPWLDLVRADRPHQLSDELEKFLHDQSVVGATAWNRLFDDTMAALSCDVPGEDGPLNLEKTLNLLSDADRAKRQVAAETLAKVFQEKVGLFTLITNTLAKDKEIRDRWRNFQTPQSSRHLANQVEGEVVQALRDAVVAAYPRISHRYYAMKAKWMGLDKLRPWDRNAPLPDDDDRRIAWSEAKDIVMSAYGEFAPKMAEIAEPFFDKGWIDAPAVEGKSSGAFAHPTVTTAHPFVMLNYLGKTRDVMTLAHELGHGVHQVLAGRQGEFLSRTPLTLAETASVFGEMLTFKRLLAAETDPQKRKALLAKKVEDMINTVVRQIAFYDFESRVHAARREGELTAEQLGEVWMAVQGESLGPAFEAMPGYETFWCYIPHFIHSPFYVYAYAFGDGLVNALYGVYEEGSVAEFEAKYFEMLAAGGTQKHKELLAPFGLDASDPAFWGKGLAVIEGMIDELEAMDA